MGGGAPPTEASAEKPAEESAKPKTDPSLTELRQEVDQLRRRDKVRDLCAESGLQPSAALLKALVALPEADAKALVEEECKSRTGTPLAPSAPAATRVRSQAPTVPLQGNNRFKLPEKAEDLVAWLRN